MSCAIVVLGSPNDAKGNLLPIAVARCQQAWVEYKKREGSKVLCTGGFGPHFNTTDTSHAQYIQDYLIKQGIPSTAFVELAPSSFTLEDATLAKPIIKQQAISKIVLVTSDFHMKRAALVFNAVFPDMEFEYASAATPVASGEYARLLAHEAKAIEREREKLNIPTSS
ncbi:YdcF family protein [Psychrobium sp. 1_MG-2023]|uniref:YdcF family protein n=1 Tax=Psychrobium sp. 1_MG-2023 TaxID=3062624 RepID=UPI000C32242B|nr:YdcF family protein [Psychrobium sp. 1_MG-2023]MDP2559739.1 YdcF family protein [Psychrobium sp. 1_MG-2023]PKF59152.1 YdcF family protein [Alteromonadales bacterium alter-6D02]